jgi:putative ABC transport system permease protein
MFNMLPFEVTKYTIEDAPVLREMAIAANPAMKPMIDMMSDEQLVDTFNSMLQESKSTYEGNLSKLGYVNLDKPTMISIYPRDFEAKEQIVELINQYNNQQEKSDKITYTDTVALLMSSVTTIINAISYVLIAFVAISLVVSSIMIGIITYISVLERTKEIGILRAIGASKKDISRVFNAETLIVGFAAGAIGILSTLLLNIIINIILFSLTGLATLKATLPVVGAIILVIISMGLTLIAGLIPSRVAAKKDPVIALRTE